MYFLRWIQICFHDFSITHTFRSSLNGWNLLHQDTKVCFCRGRRELFKDFFCLDDGVVFCNDVVPLWKFLSIYITQNGGACSLIRQKWVWWWFYSTMEKRVPSFPLAHEPTWRNVMKAWSYFWEILSMTNLSRICMVISRLWHCYSECNTVTQNTAASCASGTAGTRKNTT